MGLNNKSVKLLLDEFAIVLQEIQRTGFKQCLKGTGKQAAHDEREKRLRVGPGHLHYQGYGLSRGQGHERKDESGNAETDPGP